MNRHYLAHHGVKGQKWGVRRYQNADGSLTPAGKRHQYKEIMNESRRIKDKFYKESENYEKAESMRRRALKIADKYGLDADDGGGGDRSKYSDKVLDEAAKKYMDLWDEYGKYNDEAIIESKKQAESYMKDKYGQTYQDAINYTNTVGQAKALAFVTAAMGVSIALMNANK